MKINKNAFTLVELLVVILIIGILAAVAVPQYQKAVYKSRTAEALTMLKSLVSAQEIYYLAHGDYATDTDELDILVPKDLHPQEDTPNDPNKYYCYCQAKRQCECKAENANMPTIQTVLLNHTSNQGITWCIAHSGYEPKSNIALDICKSMGKEDLNAWKPGYYYIIN